MAKNEYEGEWTISTPAYSRELFKTVVTQKFAPFSGKNLEFCFEASYSYRAADLLREKTFRSFKLALKNLSNATIPLMSVLVCVNYSDGSTFTRYQLMVLIDGMNYVKFNLVTLDNISDSSSEHVRKMLSNTLIIKCKMTILHQDQTSDATDKEMKSCKCVDVKRNLKTLYEQSVLSDFVFKVGEKSFHAHKNILAAHSPVFMKMMIHDFMESKTNSVTVTDATPEIFDLFLKSLYGGELENTSWDSLKELYYLVDKYDVGFLKVGCSDAAISILSVDLVCEILQLAYSFSDSGIKTAAVNFAAKNIKEIVPREDWKELVKTHPMIGYDVIVNFVPK